MNDQIINIDRVRREAIAAADADRKPSDACPYRFGSPASRLWMLEFTKQVNRLAARERAARDNDPEAA